MPELSDMKLAGNTAPVGLPEEAKGQDYDGKDAPVVQPIPDDARTSMDGFELPTGYLDDDGVLHKEAAVQEITGNEEDILTSKKMPVHMRMSKIIENCIVSIGPYKQGISDWSKICKSLTASDRLYLILKIRSVSLGPLFSFKVGCPQCEKFSNQTVSLDDFTVKGIPNPRERSWTGTLPKTKWTYRARVQTGQDEGLMSKLDNSTDLMTMAIMSHLIELNGKQPIDLKTVKSLSLIDRQHLRDDFTQHEGDIDNEVEVTCPHCGEDFKTEIKIADPHFFFPSATSKL